VATNSDTVKDAIKLLKPICMDRANARKVSVVAGRWDRIGWKVEPVMKAIGKEFGKNSFKVKGLIETADGNHLKAEIDAGQTVKLGSGSEFFKIGPDYVTFSEKLPTDIFSAPMTDATVYVDVRLTPELESEGYAREIIRRIQEMRRQLDLAVEDFITAEVIVENPRICSLVSDNQKPVIADEVRARGLTIRTPAEPGAGISCQLEKDWDVEGVQVRIGISRASD
jgi:isoleucyl-tRNA synthetase